MKKNGAYLLVIIIAIAIALFLRKGPNTQPAAESDVTTTNQPTQIAKHSEPPSSQQLLIPGRPPISLAKAPDPHLAELTRTFIEEMRADPSYQFKVPIRFYGKVLDQDENPVAEAGVGFQWNTVNASNELEAAKSETKSDGAGLFSLEGKKGNAVCVTVSKPGYYNLRENPLCFEYAQPYAQNFHTPDPNNPVVFHLRKKGHGVALITSQNGIHTDLDLPIPMDGVPISVDLLHQRATDIGPLQISQAKPTNIPWQQATQWSFKMTIPDGGFVETHDEFPFEAPENGYQPAVQLDFQKDTTNWTTGIKSDYYIRFGNPPMYGLLHLETSITDSGARLGYSINPDGSRNLEPQ